MKSMLFNRSMIATFLVCFISTISPAQDQPALSGEQAGKQYAEMMERVKKFTQPGDHHKIFEKMIGSWNTETRLILGAQSTPVEKGTAETTWLMEGRWLQTKSKGTMLGQPIEGYSMMGYDNFKMSYVVTSVSSMDTAMVRQEGDMDPGGKVMLVYGTLDEYTTGEHDKMVKTVFRFESDDKMITEIHDLPIGENNTKVVEVVYLRKSQ